MLNNITTCVFRSIPDDSGKSTVLPLKIYEREKEKFQSMMDETREIASSALREEFAKIVKGKKSLGIKA